MVRARAHGTRGDDANATAIVPHDYYCMVGNDGKRYDANERVELCKGCVEFIAPAEYMMRPPQPPVYYFVIDVTYTAVTTGLLQATVNAIRRSIESFERDERTQVGFLAFDEHVHFFNLRECPSQANAFQGCVLLHQEPCFCQGFLLHVFSILIHDCFLCFSPAKMWHQ